MKPQLIAVLDVGKTHSKLSLIDSRSGVATWNARHANQVIETAGMRQLDIATIEHWLIETLRKAPERSQVAVIVPIAHGAAAVLVDENGQSLAAPDYEDERFETVAADYEKEREPFEVTLSPSLPAGLNLGRQLFYLEREQPRLFARIAHVLPYPQFWAWRLSGIMSSEVTSLGCHSDLWRPVENSFSALARSHRWSQLLPEKRFAADTLGSITLDIAQRTGLDRECRVVCGIHDSNASYLQHLIARPREQPFAVVSSGTWTVAMANRADVSILRAERDMLANVDAFGSPVGTARFMGGREYQSIARGSALPDIVALRKVVQRQAMALPSFARGGPYSSCSGTFVDAEAMDGGERAALATLYTALMTDLLLNSLAATGDILIDGPLAANPLFVALLAGRRQDNRVFASATDAPHRAACYLGGFQLSPAPMPVAAEPLSISGLDDYFDAWHQRLPLQSHHGD